MATSERRGRIAPKPDGPARTTANPVRSQLDQLQSDVKSWAQDTDLAEPVPQTNPPPPKPAPEQLPPDKPTPSPQEATRRPRWSTVLKSSVAIIAALIFGWAPLQRIFAITSSEAIVNAKLVTIRSPIEGIVIAPASGVEVGRNYEAGEAILSIDNPRSNHGAFNDLKRTRDQFAASLAALTQKRQLLDQRRSELAAQQETFRQGRITQLENRLAAIDADISAARARHMERKSTLRRTRTLRERDEVVSVATLERAIRDEQVANEEIIAHSKRRKGIEVELEGARKGTYIGDSYNDTPQSAQRLVAVELEIAELDVRLAVLRTDIANTEQALADEKKRIAAQSNVVISAAVKGRIWESLTTPGEYVNKGQDLLRMLDCETAIVTATVGEGTYHRLYIGQRATFKPRGSKRQLAGHILNLKGPVADSPGNAVVRLLTPDRFQVELKFPKLARRDNCGIGRSGLVVFEGSRLPALVRSLSPTG